MASRVAILSVVTLLVAVYQRAEASHAAPIPSQDQQSVVFNISDLRSAYLLRAGVVHYDQSNTTPDGLRQQLQRHFDVVLKLLSFATPQSIEISLDRLQAADNHSWTIQERIIWRQRLLAARLTQLQRLAAYRDRGIFPQNEGQSAHPAPIFVDRHNTACAVGHLMRCSGWANAVNSIQKSDNLVYVPDAAHTLIAPWILTSGLTLEEAALIQPGYYWEGGQFDASAYGLNGPTLQQDGLLFSNFQMTTTNYTEPNNSYTNTGATPALAGVGLLTGQGGYVDSSQPWLEYTPHGTNWMSIGVGNSQPALHSLGAYAATGRGQDVLIRFNVAATNPNQLINGISESSIQAWDGFQGQYGGLPPTGATYDLDTAAFEPNATSNLAEVHIDQSTAGTLWYDQQSATQSFPATQQFSVESEIWLENGVAINTFVLDFNVVTVPEPTTLLPLLLLILSFRLPSKSNQPVGPSPREAVAIGGEIEQSHVHSFFLTQKITAE